MKVQVYTSLEEAESARAAIDSAAGLPRVHGEREYSIAARGFAAEHLVTRGIRTDHAVEIISNATATMFAVPTGEGDDGIEVDPEVWRGAGSNPRDTRREE